MLDPNCASIWGQLLFTIFTSKLWLLLEGGFYSGTYGIFRISHSELFHEKGVLKNFAKFTGKHPGQSLLFNKGAGWRSATILKKGLRNFQKHLFCKTPANGYFCILPGYYQPGKCLLVSDFRSFIWFDYVRSINTKEMILISLQVQNEIHFNFF